MDGERNFHILYFLLRSGDAGLLRTLQLAPDPRRYHYTNQVRCLSVSGIGVTVLPMHVVTGPPCGLQGNAADVETVNDAAEYTEMMSALRTLSFARDEIVVRGRTWASLYDGHGRSCF